MPCEASLLPNVFSKPHSLVKLLATDTAFIVSHIVAAENAPARREPTSDGCISFIRYDVSEIFIREFIEPVTL
jgi:hypothetical protein